MEIEVSREFLDRIKTGEELNYSPTGSYTNRFKDLSSITFTHNKEAVRCVVTKNELIEYDNGNRIFYIKTYHFKSK